MENALVMCSILNRTCIVPPLAAHSNFYVNYNNQASYATSLTRH